MVKEIKLKLVNKECLCPKCGYYTIEKPSFRTDVMWLCTNCHAEFAEIEIWHKAHKNKQGEIIVNCGKDWTNVGISIRWDIVNCKECLKEKD